MISKINSSVVEEIFCVLPVKWTVTEFYKCKIDQYDLGFKLDSTYFEIMRCIISSISYYDLLEDTRIYLGH